MPIAWIREYKNRARVFTTTMGCSQDLENEAFRRLLVKILDYFNPAIREIVRAQRHSFMQDGVDLERQALRRPLAGKAEQVLHDLAGAVRLFQNHLQIFARTFRHFRVFHQQIRKTHNGGQGIVDLMSHAAGDASPKG